jgi:hypothetical protein
MNVRTITSRSALMLLMGLGTTIYNAGAQKPPHRKAAAKPTTASPSVVEKEARATGTRLLNRLQAGQIMLVNRDRDLPQFKSLAGQGCLCGENGKPVTISIRLLRLLDRLSARSNKKHPLELLSVYRKPVSSRTREPHANGLAVDVAQFAGRRIDNHNPKDALAGVISVVDALGPGNYRLGLPKPPATDPVALAPPPPRPKSWPFFPAPLPVVAPLPVPGLPAVAIVLPDPHESGAAIAARGVAAPLVRRWANERGADLSEVGSADLRRAIQRAAKRGAVVHTLFPDAVDHVHLDVVPPPGEKGGPAISLRCCDD